MDGQTKCHRNGKRRCLWNGNKNLLYPFLWHLVWFFCFYRRLIHFYFRFHKYFVNSRETSTSYFNLLQEDAMREFIALANEIDDKVREATTNHWIFGRGHTHNCPQPDSLQGPEYQCIGEIVCIWGNSTNKLAVMAGSHGNVRVRSGAGP